MCRTAWLSFLECPIWVPSAANSTCQDFWKRRGTYCMSACLLALHDGARFADECGPVQLDEIIDCGIDRVYCVSNASPADVAQWSQSVGMDKSKV